MNSLSCYKTQPNTKKKAKCLTMKEQQMNNAIQHRIKYNASMKWSSKCKLNKVKKHTYLKNRNKIL